MGLDAVVKHLLEFGISEREASTFLTLSRLGPAKAGEVSRRTGVDRVQTYQILDSLQSKGFVEFTVERPRRYVAVPLERVLDRYFDERANETRRKEATRANLLQLWPTLLGGREPASPIRFQMVRGTGPIYATLRQFLNQAGEVLAFTTRRGLVTSYREDAHRSLLKAVEAGGRVRLIAEVDEANAWIAREFLRRPALGGRIEIRHLDHQLARLTIVDRREVLLFLVPDGSPVREELALWTNGQDFVQAQVDFFEEAWQRGRPLEEHLRDLGRAPGGGGSPPASGLHG